MLHFHNNTNPPKINKTFEKKKDRQIKCGPNNESQLWIEKMSKGMHAALSGTGRREGFNEETVGPKAE